MAACAGRLERYYLGWGNPHGADPRLFQVQQPWVPCTWVDAGLRHPIGYPELALVTLEC